MRVQKLKIEDEPNYPCLIRAAFRASEKRAVAILRDIVDGLGTNAGIFLGSVRKRPFEYPSYYAYNRHLIGLDLLRKGRLWELSCLCFGTLERHHLSAPSMVKAVIKNRLRYNN